MAALRYKYRKENRHKRGAVLIDFCLIIPLFALFMVLMLDLVIVVRTVTVMDAAAYRIVRDAAIQGGPGALANAEQAFDDRLEEYTTGHHHLIRGVGTGPADPELKIEFRVIEPGSSLPPNSGWVDSSVVDDSANRILCTQTLPLVSVRINYGFDNLNILDGYQGFVNIDGKLVDRGTAVATDRCYTAG